MTQVLSNFKAKKQPKDRKYIGFVKQLPCVICDAFGEPFGQAPSDAHHTFCGRFSGVRTPDSQAIPLCRSHHLTGENNKTAIHLNKAEFVAKYREDVDYIDVTRDRIECDFNYIPKGF